MQNEKNKEYYDLGAKILHLKYYNLMKNKYKESKALLKMTAYQFLITCIASLFLYLSKTLEATFLVSNVFLFLMSSVFFVNLYMMKVVEVYKTRMKEELKLNLMGKIIVTTCLFSSFIFLIPSMGYFEIGNEYLMKAKVILVMCLIGLLAVSALMFIIFGFHSILEYMYTDFKEEPEKEKLDLNKLESSFIAKRESIKSDYNSMLEISELKENSSFEYQLFDLVKKEFENENNVQEKTAFENSMENKFLNMKLENV